MSEVLTKFPKPLWLELYEEEDYRGALKESVLSGTCFGAQMQAMAALVIADAVDQLADKV